MLPVLLPLALLGALASGTPAVPSTPAAQAAPASGDAFDALVARWSLVRDYTVTISTFETNETKTVRSVLQYAFRKPHRARIEVVAGSNRGAVVVWDGGDAVTVYKRGFLSAFKVHVTLRDARVQSLRGNGVLTPDLGETLACFAAHRANVRVLPGPAVGGDETDAIELQYAGFTCPGDSPVDAAVTRDRLDVARRTGSVVRRERYARETLVESYDLTKLEVNPGLDPAVFR